MIASAGTAATSGKWPSPTCWRRHASSSATTFTSSGVGEVGDGRVVEREVAVLADPEAAEVERVVASSSGVAAAFGVGVRRVAVDEVERTDRDPLDDPLAHVAGEARGVVGSDARRTRPCGTRRPRDQSTPASGDERVEERELRVAGREHRRSRRPAPRSRLEITSAAWPAAAAPIDVRVGQDADA